MQIKNQIKSIVSSKEIAEKADMLLFGYSILVAKARAAYAEIQYTEISNAKILLRMEAEMEKSVKKIEIGSEKLMQDKHWFRDEFVIGREESIFHPGFLILLFLSGTLKYRFLKSLKEEDRIWRDMNAFLTGAKGKSLLELLTNMAHYSYFKEEYDIRLGLRTTSRFSNFSKLNDELESVLNQFPDNPALGSVPEKFRIIIDKKDVPVVQYILQKANEKSPIFQGDDNAPTGLSGFLKAIENNHLQEGIQFTFALRNNEAAELFRKNLHKYFRKVKRKGPLQFIYNSGLFYSSNGTLLTPALFAEDHSRHTENDFILWCRRFTLSTDLENELRLKLKLS